MVNKVTNLETVKIVFRVACFENRVSFASCLTSEIVKWVLTLLLLETTAHFTISADKQLAKVCNLTDSIKEQASSHEALIVYYKSCEGATYIDSLTPKQ